MKLLPTPHFKTNMQMKVDTARDQMLHIHFNVSFPALPCSAIVLDTGDSSGQYRSEYGLSFAKCVGVVGVGWLAKPWWNKEVCMYSKRNISATLISFLFLNR